ncbi:MAG: hypothetical protein ABW219_03105 [Ilumatobacteraceae bacterium]
MRTERRLRPWRRLAPLVLLGATGVLATPVVGASPAVAQQAPDGGEVPFAPVFEGVLAGDLVMAGNSNLLSAGGWRLGLPSVADVDGDTTPLCIGRRYVPAACADNSTSATLDVPAGARIVHARLYVDTTLSPAVGPLRVRLDGPAEGYDYQELTAHDGTVPNVYEGAGGAPTSAMMRQAVWDVTDYVTAGGPGTYTVADIVSERAGAWLPYSSWAIVVAYELDPASGIQLDQLPAAERQRFAPRAVSWHDGFVVRSEGSVDVTVAGFAVSPGEPVFAKSFHVIAHPQARGADNLLFAGSPLGNNLTPGNGPAPAGVLIGNDAACNTITDVLDDSICLLGHVVETKVPGPGQYRASGDGRSVTSGSAVDMDVIRIPDRYFTAGMTSATLSVTAGGGAVAPGLLAVSVDLDPPVAPVPVAVAP